MKLESRLESDLCRLARFGANLTEAYSCFIFLPQDVRVVGSSQSSAIKSLKMYGYHSLSREVVEDCEISSDNGLIGWVSTHGRSIHVSPFEHDSRTLGIYSTDQLLKSFIGIPVDLEPKNETPQAAAFSPRSAGKPGRARGVIACDSKKSFAFSKIQGKLLEDLALEVSNVVDLLLVQNQQLGAAECAASSWPKFLRAGKELTSSLGYNSIEVMRLIPKNLLEMEVGLGTERALAVFDQLYRLVLQSLPAGVPIYRGPSGDLILLLDNMTTAFYESRIRAICDHFSPGVGKASFKVDFSFVKCSARNKKYRGLELEGLISESARLESAESAVLAPGSRFSLEERVSPSYEYRRA